MGFYNAPQLGRERVIREFRFIVGKNGLIAVSRVPKSWFETGLTQIYIARKIRPWNLKIRPLL